MVGSRLGCQLGRGTLSRRLLPRRRPRPLAGRPWRPRPLAGRPWRPRPLAGRPWRPRPLAGRRSGRSPLIVPDESPMDSPGAGLQPDNFSDRGNAPMDTDELVNRPPKQQLVSRLLKRRGIPVREYLWNGYRPLV